MFLASIVCSVAVRYELDETSGSTSADSSGKGNTLTLQSGAISLNGTTQYLSAPDSASLRTPSSQARRRRAS